MRQFIRFIFILLVSVTLANAQTQYFNRDTTNVVGGFGRVDSAVKIHTTSGVNETAFEWGLLSLLYNYSNAGENVAIYAQSNARGKGQTWGLVAEVCDESEQNASLVGQEITMNMAGPDNGNRIGLDITIGDARLWRGKGQSDVAEASVGVRVNAEPLGTPASTAKRSWNIGFQTWGFRTSGLHTTGMLPQNTGWTAAGKYQTLIGAYGTQFDSFMQLSGFSPAFKVQGIKPQIGCLKVMIDGNPYCVPIQVW